MSEIWRKIKDFEKYEISNLGNVRKNMGTLRGTDHYVPIKVFPGTNLYLNFNVHQNGVHRQLTVHKTVAEAFIKNDDPQTKKIVNHINHNKFDNRSENLEWTTQYENCDVNRKPVYQYTKDGEFVREWESLSAPVRECPAVFKNISGLSACCTHRTKTAYGYIWKFKEEVEAENGIHQ